MPEESTRRSQVYFLIRAPDPPTFGEALGKDSEGVCLLPGWNPGLPFLPTSGLWGLGYFAVKVFAVLFLFIWMRGTLPRFRYDQLMSIGWKVLIPAVTVWIMAFAAAVALFPSFFEVASR